MIHLPARIDPLLATAHRALGRVVDARTAEWIAGHPWLAALCAPAATLATCPAAYAANDPKEALSTILGYVGNGTVLIGGAVCIFGAVQLGLAIKGGATGGGGQLSGAIAMIVGGAVVVIAGAWFKGLDTSLTTS